MLHWIAGYHISWSELLPQSLNDVCCVFVACLWKHLLFWAKPFPPYLEAPYILSGECYSFRWCFIVITRAQHCSGMKLHMWVSTFALFLHEVFFWLLLPRFLLNKVVWRQWSGLVSGVRYGLGYNIAWKQLKWYSKSAIELPLMCFWSFHFLKIRTFLYFFILRITSCTSTR